MKLITAIVEPDVTDDLVLAVSAAGQHQGRRSAGAGSTVPGAGAAWYLVG